MGWPWARSVEKEPVEDIAGRLEAALQKHDEATNELRELLDDVKYRRSASDNAPR